MGGTAYGGQGCAARQPDRQEARHRPGRSRNRAPDIQACSHGHSSTSCGRNTSSSQAARVTRQGRRRGERMPSRMTLHDRTAVITGAGSGIGRAIAQALARRGCHLALVDISEPGLAETVQLVDGASIRISRHRLDVADHAAVATLPQAGPWIGSSEPAQRSRCIDAWLGLGIQSRDPVDQCRHDVTT